MSWTASSRGGQPAPSPMQWMVSHIPAGAPKRPATKLRMGMARCLPHMSCQACACTSPYLVTSGLTM